MILRNITSESEFDELLASSTGSQVLLFKHSNACPVSSRAHSQVDRFLATDLPELAAAAIVVVQTARALSARIEERLGIRHESPQAIVLRDGKPVWNASHYDVTEARLADAIARR